MKYSRFRLAFAALAACSMLGACVSLKGEDGRLAVRFSKFADEAEVDALAKRVDATDKSVSQVREDLTAAINANRADSDAADVKIREDILAQQKAATEAFDRAIAAGKDAAAAVRDGATAAVQTATELATKAKDTADAAKKKSDETAMKQSADAAAAQAAAKTEFDKMLTEIRAGKLGPAEIAEAVKKYGSTDWTSILIALAGGGALTGGGVAVHSRGKRRRDPASGGTANPGTAAASPPKPT